MTDPGQSFITFCSSCDTRLKLPAKVRDKRIRCPHCQEPTLAVPKEPKASATRVVEVPREPERKPTGLLVPVLLLAVLLVGGIAWWASTRSAPTPPPNPSTAATESRSTPEPDTTQEKSEETETSTATEVPAPEPPKTPLEALLALADPVQRSHLESLQAALKSDEPATSEERDRWLALLKDTELQQALAWWLTEEWFHASDWSRRVAAVRLVPEFGSDSRDALFDAASEKFLLAHFAAKLTVQLGEHERAARELSHENPLRRFTMAAAIRHWKNPPPTVLTGIVRCLLEVPGEPAIQHQCIATLENLAQLEGPGPKATLTPVQAAIMEAIRDLATRHYAKLQMGQRTSDQWFQPLADILIDSRLKDVAARDELLAIFLDARELHVSAQVARQRALAGLIEDRPEARAVWEEKVQHCVDLRPQRKSSSWKPVVGEFGCDLEHWDTVVALAGRGHNPYQDSLALSSAECRQKLFAYVESTGSSAENHLPIATTRWLERYRRHPEYAVAEASRFCAIALDESRTKVVREAAVRALRGMGGAISLTPAIERVAKSQYGGDLLGSFLKHDRRKLSERVERQLGQKGRSFGLYDQFFVVPPTDRSELDVLSSCLRQFGYSRAGGSHYWAPLGRDAFRIEVRNSIDWQIAVLAHAPYEIAATLAETFEDSDRTTLAERLHKTLDLQPMNRRAALLEWFPLEDPPDISNNPIGVLDDIVKRYRRSTHHSSLTRAVLLMRDRLQVDLDQLTPDLRALLREDAEVQLAMLRALSVWDSGATTGLVRMLQPVDLEVLPFLPIFERKLAAKNATYTSGSVQTSQKLWVSLLSGGIALEGW